MSFDVVLEVSMKHFLISMLLVLSAICVSGCQYVYKLLPTQTPYPTYTPYPTFTPIPSPTSTPEKKIIYQEDDFSNIDSCFDVFSDSTVRLFAENDAYHIAVQIPIYFGWTFCDREIRNFVMEVDATVVSGPSNNNYAYGIVFRRDSTTEGFYAFLISGDGYYSFSGIYPDDYYPLLAWSPIREIKQGEQINHLKVVAVGDQFELYVNNALVGLVRENTLKSGPFGFIVETFDDPEVEVVFDNLIVTEP